MLLSPTLVALGVTLAACSTSGSSGRPGATSSNPAGSGATITIQNFAFDPGTLRVPPGAEVTVVNDDGVTHTVTSTTGVFDTGDIQHGATAHFTAPKKAGSYPYRCTIHQFMTGTLVVTTG
jgi:plastocyanin